MGYYVEDTSTWENWQREYRLGLILIIPPEKVLRQIEPLRMKYDPRSFRCYPAHISISDPLCEEVTPELQREIEVSLRGIDPFTLYYDKPSASKEHPGVVYPIRPQEPIDELKRVLHASSAFRGRAYCRRDILAHMTIAELLSIEESMKVCAELLDSAPTASFLCDRLELIVPNENFQFQRCGTFFLKQPSDDCLI